MILISICRQLGSFPGPMGWLYPGEFFFSSFWDLGFALFFSAMGLPPVMPERLTMPGLTFGSAREVP